MLVDEASSEKGSKGLMIPEGISNTIPSGSEIKRNTGRHHDEYNGVVLLRRHRKLCPWAFCAKGMNLDGKVENIPSTALQCPFLHQSDSV